MAPHHPGKNTTMLRVGRVAVFLILACPQGLPEIPDIHVAPGKYRDYYHMRFTLTPQNTELTVPLSERRHRHAGNNESALSAKGQFEVFVRRDSFPVDAPGISKKFLVLRMPPTWTRFQHDPSNIQGKRDLFEQIQQMMTTRTGKVDVMVELNPYVRVVTQQPLNIVLTQPNIFFRQAYGKYIAYPGPLKNADRNRKNK